MKDEGLLAFQLALRLRLSLALTLTLSLIVSTASAQTNKRQSTTVETIDVGWDGNTPPAVEDNRDLAFGYYFIDAVCQQNAGKFDEAFQSLQRCLEINPEAPEVWYMISAHYSSQGNDSTALACIEKAAALNPQNDVYQERVGQYYITESNYDRAIATYERLYDNHRTRFDVLSILLSLYHQKKDYPNIIRTLDRMEQLEGNNEDITLAKMQAYQQMDNDKMAEKTLEKLISEFPNEVNYRVMMGNWIMQNGKPKNAYKIFMAALKEEPDNDYAMASLCDYYVATGQDSLANRLRDQILTSRKTPVETKITMLQQIVRESERNGGDSIRLLNLMDRIIDSDPADSEVPMFKAVYMNLKQMPKSEVDKALRHVLSVAPDNAMARFTLLQDLWPSQDWDEIIAVSQPGIEYNPEEMAFYYFNGLAWFQKDDHDRALDAFQRGVSQINDKSNPEIVSDFYAIMGDILHQKGLDEAAFAAYDSCLQWKDDNITCLNNYAYYLSLKDKDEELLRRAEKMSYKTVQAEPENSTYLDTYAWILFMQGRYEEARIYIDQAIGNDVDPDESAVILEHAGDIHAVTDDIDGAVGFWQKAYDLDDDAIDMTLLQKKIKQRKYIKKENE